MNPKSKPKYFPTAVKLRLWFEANHAAGGELWVGYYKKSSGRPSITWPESVDEALCFGWIDGLRKSIDDRRYMIRFSPRKPTSIWSAVNMKRARELKAAGRMHPNGVQAFEARKAKRSGVYSYERRSVDLPARFAREFRAHAIAWADFRGRPPSYRKAVHWWIVSPKREETRERRLAQLIECHAEGRILPQYSWSKKPAG